jgi:hypothetical protein
MEEAAELAAEQADREVGASLAGSRDATDEDQGADDARVRSGAPTSVSGMISG